MAFNYPDTDRIIIKCLPNKNEAGIFFRKSVVYHKNVHFITEICE